MKFLILTFFLFSCVSTKICLSQKFRWHDEKGKYKDLSYNKKNLIRYVYERMDLNDRERTYKPFHHIYQSNGKDFLTKGPGGKFTHHRGIYFGFSKCTVPIKNGNVLSVDTWHCKRAYQTHEKTIFEKSTDEEASHSEEIAWRLDDGTVFATELRTLIFSMKNNGSLVIDFKSELHTDKNFIQLDGDPQHAGFQFRASNEVAESSSMKTYYIRPNEGRDENGATKNWPQDKDMTNMLWKAQSIVLGDERYTTVYLDHPQNPKPSFYSERNYGRFGSYFKYKITPSNPLSVRYRLIVGRLERTMDECQKLSGDYINRNKRK